MAKHRFLEQIENRVTVLDGGMGTSVQNMDLDLEKDFWDKENCTEVLVLSRPDAVQRIHEEFLEAGSDAVETDTFGGMTHVLAEFDLQDRCREINREAVKIARKACDNHQTPEKPRFVVGSIGPGTKLISLGQISWDEMYASYREQVMGLLEGGPDVLLMETQQDLLAVKCIILATLDAYREMGLEPATLDNPDADGPPIMVQVTIEQFGTTLTGSEIGAVAVALEHYPIVSLGLNCATGPEDMAEHVRFLAENWPRHISVLPNAGLPTLVDGETVYPLGPDAFAKTMSKFVDDFGLSIVGGCCGTTPEHLGKLKAAVDGRPVKWHHKTPVDPAATSLFSTTDYRQQGNSLMNIGERLNASGSRKFKRLLEEENWDEMISLAREQVREGGHVLDVNVDYAGRDNADDMATIVSQLVRQVDAPLMLDSTQPATIEAGLKKAGGKCIINSANLEEGEEKFAAMCELARKYQAGLVLGCIDEDPDEAMARTEERKISIAHRMFKLATEKYGIQPTDIFFDPLVLPISTGMDKDRRSGLETVAGVKRIAEELPETQTTVGLSNVSFGLKPVARQVLNSVFLAELQHAGLTSAIVHSSKILPKNKVDDAQWDAALDLVYNRWREEGDEVTLDDGAKTRDPLQIFVNLFPDDQAEISTRVDLADLPLDERLQRHIIDGEKKNLDETLEEALPKYGPLAIINEHLLAGMKVVGELFGSGQMQLPFVLQSAEVMKTAVAHLEPHMEKKEGDTKGTIVLATVKGDVHDIGKNLVDIILSNNGYKVHNIGIKQPVDAIVKAWKETKADAIGMSGLLVKSVQAMELNLKEMNEMGVDVPVLLGGAALSKHYCESHLRSVYHGNVYHGRDAFEGLRLMDSIKAGEEDQLNAEIEERLTKRAETEEKVAAMKAKKAEQKAAEKPVEEPVAVGAAAAGGGGGGTAVAEGGGGDAGDDNTAALRSDATGPTGGDRGVSDIVTSNVDRNVDVPEPPFWGDRLVEDVPLDNVYPFINEVALFRGQWQFKKGRMSDAEYEAQLEDEVRPLFDRLKAQLKNDHVLKPRLVYGYFPVNSDPHKPNDLVVYDPQDHDREVSRFSFPRQDGKKHYCISDFFRAADTGEKDVLGMTCVTVGTEVSELAKELFESNQYSEYLYVHGLGVETAEALAELWHKRMRQELGIVNDDAAKVRDLFTQKYRGSRYSFGYPACPDMSDQEKLFALLKPERIGCELTENWQIDPEQSTSAIIVHHPEAKYFNV